MEEEKYFLNSPKAPKQETLSQLKKYFISLVQKISQKEHHLSSLKQEVFHPKNEKIIQIA